MWFLNHILLYFFLPCVVHSRMQVSIGENEYTESVMQRMK